MYNLFNSTHTQRITPLKFEKKAYNVYNKIYNTEFISLSIFSHVDQLHEGDVSPGGRSSKGGGGVPIIILLYDAEQTYKPALYVKHFNPWCTDVKHILGRV